MITIIDIDKSEINGPIIKEIGNNINSALGIFSKKNCLFIINKAQFFNHIKINHKRNWNKK